MGQAEGRQRRKVCQNEGLEMAHDGMAAKRQTWRMLMRLGVSQSSLIVDFKGLVMRCLPR